jgi:hypothetical protein
MPRRQDHPQPHDGTECIAATSSRLTSSAKTRTSALREENFKVAWETGMGHEERFLPPAKAAIVGFEAATARDPEESFQAPSRSMSRRAILCRHDADGELGRSGIVWAVEGGGCDRVAARTRLGSVAQPRA